MSDAVARRPRRTREELVAQRAEDEARRLALGRYRVVYGHSLFAPVLDGRVLEGTSGGLASAIEKLTAACERRGYNRSYLADRTLAWLIHIALEGP